MAKGDNARKDKSVKFTDSGQMRASKASQFLERITSGEVADSTARQQDREVLELFGGIGNAPNPSSDVNSGTSANGGTGVNGDELITAIQSMTKEEMVYFIMLSVITAKELASILSDTIAILRGISSNPNSTYQIDGTMIATLERRIAILIDSVTIE